MRPAVIIEFTSENVRGRLLEEAVELLFEIVEFGALVLHGCSNEHLLIELVINAVFLGKIDEAVVLLAATVVVFGDFEAVEGAGKCPIAIGRCSVNIFTLLFVLGILYLDVVGSDLGGIPVLILAATGSPLRAPVVLVPGRGTVC